MSCTTTAIKYLVFIFNTLCALFGIGTIVVASLALKNVAAEGKGACIGIIVIGSIVFLVSFFGCFGAIRENVFFTWTYAILLTLLIICNIVIIFTTLKHIDGEKNAKVIIEKAWDDEIHGTFSMASIERNFKCCGVNGTIDYENENMTIPDSCYKDGSEHRELYTEGCLKKLIEALENSEKFVRILVWVSLGVEVVSLLCAATLAIHFRNLERRSRY